MAQLGSGLTLGHEQPPPPQHQAFVFGYAFKAKKQVFLRFHFFKRWKLHMAQFYWPSTSLGRSCPYKGFKLNFLPIIFRKIYLYNKVGTP